MIDSVLRVGFEELVAEAVKLVHAMTRCQFAVGGAALEITPLRSHGGDMSLGEDELGGGEGALRMRRSGCPSIRSAPIAGWPRGGLPIGDRRARPSGPPDSGARAGRVEQIKDPPVNERTGRRQSSGDAAKRAAGWATATPVTVQEKVESIRDLTVDETVAVQQACELLQRPEVAFRAMRDRQALTAFLTLRSMPDGRVSREAARTEPSLQRKRTWRR